MQTRKQENKKIDKAISILISVLFITVILCGCFSNKGGLKDLIVVNYVDSLCQLCEPIRDNRYERIKIDEYYLYQRRKQWQYADTIAKYCETNDLIELTTRHKSLAVRYVSFKLLLERNSHDAVRLLIDDIDSNDSIIATRLDEGFPELLSSLKVDLVQNNRAKYRISVDDSLSVDDAVLNSKNKYKIHYYHHLQSQLGK